MEPHEQDVLALTLTSELKEKLDRMTYKAERDNLPLESESVDLLVNHGAMPGAEWYESQDFREVEKEIEDSFD